MRIDFIQLSTPKTDTSLDISIKFKFHFQYGLLLRNYKLMSAPAYIIHKCEVYLRLLLLFLGIYV